MMDCRLVDREAVRVRGEGKISVDVKAPRGTKVKAEGGGLFKKTEVTRQSQKEPAREGPSAAPPAME